MFTVCGLGISVYSAARACPMFILHVTTAAAISCGRTGGTVFIAGLVMAVSLLQMAALRRAEEATR
jgi:hypothetical protein